MKTVQKDAVINFADFKLKEEDGLIPLLMIKVHSTDEANEDVWAEVQKLFDKYYENKQNCRMVIDLTKTQMIFSMTYMQQWSDFFKKNRKYLREHVKYVAFISENQLFKNLFSIMINLNKPQIPFYVINSKKDIEPL